MTGRIHPARNYFPRRKDFSAIGEFTQILANRTHYQTGLISFLSLCYFKTLVILMGKKTPLQHIPGMVTGKIRQTFIVTQQGQRVFRSLLVSQAPDFVLKFLHSHGPALGIQAGNYRKHNQ